jgi:carboxypeptidase D
MPISSQKNASELYFWFFPSEDTHASDEILIYLAQWWSGLQQS